jgi:hypothetical protein
MHSLLKSYYGFEKSNIEQLLLDSLKLLPKEGAVAHWILLRTITFLQATTHERSTVTI